MIKVADLRRVTRAELKKLGFEGKNSDWRYPPGEVEWCVHLDTGAWGKQLGVRHELFLPDGASRIDPGFPDVSISVDNNPLYQGNDVSWEAWYINTDLEPDERYRMIRQILSKVAEYTRTHLTLDSVRAAYEHDYKDRALIHWRARNYFEGCPLDERPTK